jgi:hypothetical protein
MSKVGGGDPKGSTALFLVLGMPAQDVALGDSPAPGTKIVAMLCSASLMDLWGVLLFAHVAASSSLDGVIHCWHGNATSSAAASVLQMLLVILQECFQKKSPCDVVLFLIVKTTARPARDFCVVTQLGLVFFLLRLRKQHAKDLAPDAA